MLSNRQKTGIVIPCFNEANRLQFQCFLDFIAQNKDCFFCFVNDGSEDKTGEILDQFVDRARKSAAVIHLKCNTGKAQAVREGVQYLLQEHHLKFVGYWDADGASPLKEISRFIEILETHLSFQFVLGSRIRRAGANIQRHWYRHYMGRLFATFASFILKLPVYDTQCGAKLIRVGLAEDIFKEPFVTNWTFDVELIARVIAHKGIEKTKEILFELPMENWADKEGSKMGTLNILETPFELYKIFREYSLFKNN